MKKELSEIDTRLIHRVDDIIGEETYIDIDGYVDVDDLLSMLDSLEDKYKDLESEFEEYKLDIKENYKRCDINDNHEYYESTITKLNNEVNKQYRFIKEKGLEEEYGKYRG